MLRSFFVLFLATATSGCATLFSDGSQQIKVTSNVEHANVLLDGEPVGYTPSEFTLDHDTFAQHEITLTAEGYVGETINVKKSFNTTALWNCTSWFLWSTDALSGSMIEYSPGAYHIELQRRTGGTSLEQRQLVYFVITNHERFLRDVSKRSGEYLSTVAQLSGVSAGEFPAFADALARRLPRMTREPYPYRLLLHIQEVRASQEFVSVMLALATPEAPHPAWF